MSRKYWTLTNYILPEDRHKSSNPERTRNTQALLCSDDLIQWQIRDIVLHHPDMHTHAFQYLDWLIEGSDLIAVSRTAWDQPDGQQAICQHHANYLTFHRIKDFRTRTKPEGSKDVAPAR